jgi:hypothetical protein
MSLAGHQRPFTHAVARTFERRLHPDSGPSSNDAIRRVVGHCGNLRGLCTTLDEWPLSEDSVEKLGDSLSQLV